jgi:hypothetical protein
LKTLVAKLNASNEFVGAYALRDGNLHGFVVKGPSDFEP